METVVENPVKYDYPTAARYLGIGEQTLRQYVSKGLIGYRKLGPKLVRFTQENLDAFLNARTFRPESN